MRRMSVAGSFYPIDPNEIIQMIHLFNEILDSNPNIVNQLNHLKSNAIVVPHAGWIYSGFTANIAYRVLKNQKPTTVIVIGPSHRIGFEGVSVATDQLYETPLGDVAMDSTLIQECLEKLGCIHIDNAHFEHSTEVQIPFLKYYLPECKIVELVYSSIPPSKLEPIIEYFLSLPDTAVVISTDLSHYYPLEQAKQLDSICLDALKNRNVNRLHQGCEACGKIGVETMIEIATKRGLKTIILDYRTSADTSKDPTRVVGYASALFN